MQKVIAREKEPITPFLERVQDLYKQADISTILVVGSCGSYFYTADTIIQMDHYRPVDITQKTKGLLSGYPSPSLSAPDFKLPDKKRRFRLSSTPNVEQRKNYYGKPMEPSRLKVKVSETDSITLGRETIDLRYLEQLIDKEQTAALSYLLRFAKEHLDCRRLSSDEMIEELIKKIRKDGLASICGSSYIPSGLAMPRVQEIFACFNRY